MENSAVYVRPKSKNMKKFPLSITLLAGLLILIFACQNQTTQNEEVKESPIEKTRLRAQANENVSTISVFREGETAPVLIQNARPDFRPYIHPLAAPDGQGVLTEYSPSHHKHQTGLYWGFTRLNGRDYFHNPDGDYWKRIAFDVLDSAGVSVQWQTVYHLLNEKGSPVLEETQIWSMQEQDGKFFLTLEWRGKALQDVAIGEYDYGGLFLRMPWYEGIAGEVVNAARQRDQLAEGQRAMWVDVGMQIKGREDWAHIAIFDHPKNQGYPQPWRVDGQLGVGPVRARLGDWKIKTGQTEIIQHQLMAYAGELNDVELTNYWKNFSGVEATYATASLWGIAQKEGREAKFLTAEEAVENMTIKDGFQVDAWASEPMITQPMAFCWDDRGRMWIAENRDYESRGHGFSNSGDSRILILEDTDGDGKADSRKVFLEGIPFPAAIAVGFDGLFLGAPPNLLFVPDRDGDDVADMNDVEVRLTGWGIRDRHETINSLHWGPDGWLYGLEGFATPSKIRKPIGKGRLYKHKEAFPENLLEAEGVDVNGGVWRYHPTKDRFEVVAHGFSNPWGIDYDAKGQLFISACVIPHLFHVIPGGIYHRQGGRHFNPYVYSDIRTIVDHRHRSAHGGARVYLSDAFPKEHRGRLFMANIHEHAVLSDVLEPQGSGFVARHGDDFMMANNAQWIGFSMEVGPEGALYVLDWHDADICGKDVLNKETGRIFRISPKESLAKEWEGRYADLAGMSDLKLAELQVSESAWHARRARVILQNRAHKGSISEEAKKQLQEIFKTDVNPDWRLRAMWALHLADGFTEDELIASLNDSDPHIRAWAIQLLCEDATPSTAALKKFVQLARKDPAPVVRLYLAAALQRIEADARWNIVLALATRAEDADDHNIPKMTWFGLEPLVAENPDRALDVAAKSKIPLLAEFTARRIVDADATDKLIAKLGKRSTARISLLQGMRSGLEGRSDLVVPANWPTVYPKLKKQKDLAPIALELAQIFGDAEAAKQYMTALQNKQAPLETRLQALNGLAAQQWKELPEQLPALLDEPDLRIAAIRAVAEFENNQLGNLLLEKYPGFNAQEKLEAILTMASRSTYGGILTQALKEERISKRDIPAYAARQLRRVVGNGFVEIWGPIDQLSNNQEAAYVRYRALLTNEAIAAADPGNGRLLFQGNCGACHKMYGEGGLIGPDITGSNRTNTDYLLSNILDPSGEIQEDYKMMVVTTQDGRTFMGNIAAENERQITMRIVGQDALVINKSEIQSRETTSLSMMPQGLLETLTETEVLDLIAYLQTTEQVPLPEK